jgi:cation transport ATPase
MPSLDAEIQATEQRVEQTNRAVEDWRQRQQERQQDDRSLIAKIIVWAFVLLMGVVILIVAVGTLLIGWDKLSEPAKFLMSILGSVMLPVVTLVIGYYFGKEK